MQCNNDYRITLILFSRATAGGKHPRLSQATSIKQGSIMLVDDESDLSEVLALGLEEDGHRVNSFTDAAEALEKFKEAPDEYSLILADIRMSPMDGIELAKQVLKVRWDTKIIFMTALEIKGNIKRKLNELPQQCEVILKPFSFSDLREKLRLHQYTFSEV